MSVSYPTGPDDKDERARAFGQSVRAWTFIAIRGSEAETADPDIDRIAVIRAMMSVLGSEAEKLQGSSGAATSHRRRGRPRVDSDPAQRLKHIGAAFAVIVRGRPCTEVAEAFGVTTSTIRNWIGLALKYEGPTADELRMVVSLTKAN